MKKKIILMSLLSIFLCASLITGATFALFTSESEANIVVSSGKVEILATIDDSSVATKELGDANYTQGTDNTFAGDVNVNVATGTVTLSKLVPGDGVKFNINITNKSNTSIKYRTRAIVENGFDLYSAMEVTFNGGQPTWTLLEAAGTIASVEVELVLPEDTGNAYQDKTAKFKFIVEAVQGNGETIDSEIDQVATPSEGTVEVPAGNAEDLVVSTDNGMVTVKVPASSIDTETSTLTLNVTPITDVSSQEDFDTVIESDTGVNVVFYDISLSGLTEGNTQPLEVSIFVGKGFEEVLVYHNNAGEIERIDGAYDAVTGYVTFTATSFSPFAFETVKKFDGGTGTQEDPYLIANERQFRNIAGGAYYKLTADIYLSEGTSYETYWVVTMRALNNVHLDGNNYSVYNTVSGSAFFGQMVSSDVKNVNFVLKGDSLVVDCQNVTFENVEVSGEAIFSNNTGAFIVYAYKEVNLIDCEVSAVIKPVNGSTSCYNAVFVGYPMNTSTITFENCIHSGDFTSGKSSMFIGNPHYSSFVLNINNCRNTGTIKATVASSTPDTYKFNPITAITNDGSHTVGMIVNLDGVKYEDNAILEIPFTYFGGQFINGTIDPDMSLTIGEDNQLMIQASQLEEVSYYIVNVGVYAVLNQGGTSLNVVKERVEAENPITTLKAIEFVDTAWVEANSDAVMIQTDNYTMYEKDGKQYYYLIYPDISNLGGIPKMATEFGLTAYDASGNVLFTTGLTK